MLGLGLGLGLESHDLGLGLGLRPQIAGHGLGLGGCGLGLGLESHGLGLGLGLDMCGLVNITRKRTDRVESVDSFGLDLCGVRMCGAFGIVCRHHADLSAHHDHDTTIAEQENDHWNNEVGRQNPDVDARTDQFALPDEIRQAHAVFHRRRDEHHWSNGQSAANPGKHHRGVYHPSLQ